MLNTECDCSLVGQPKYIDVWLNPNWKYNIEHKLTGGNNCKWYPSDTGALTYRKHVRKAFCKNAY